MPEVIASADEKRLVCEFKSGSGVVEKDNGVLDVISKFSYVLDNITIFSS